jgi:hemolysin III
MNLLVSLSVFKKTVFKKKIKDSGPEYKETNMNKFIVEPFNTFSNIGFLAIVFYWLIMLWSSWRYHKFLSLCVILLFVGWFGGTMYHAKRNRDLWLFLDVGPIFIISLFAIIYFWTKTKLTWVWGLIISLLPFIIRIFLGKHPKPSISFLGYCVVILPALIPLVVVLFMNDFANWIYLFLAVLFFGVALFFRTVDLKVKFKRGTHWLWHIFGAFAVQSTFMFIFLL